jgi:hypothetical protein
MSNSVNLSRLREMAVKGKNYREEYELDYFGETATLVLKSLVDEVLIPVAAILEDKFDMDVDEAREELDDAKDESGSIDPSQLDAEFVRLMADVAVNGIDREEGAAAGESKEGVREIFGIAEDDEENIGLRGGKTLEIAEAVLDISSDADSAEKFRR